ncbi:peptidyl-prolyl cis-trans isomerase [Calocera viscosa TUFC12733]|uniref:peptidylprolyl isomerase n=1 Tax=Calocera viscosa (strain TUFC12733) TaxID=1330018 RepID=A0A167RV72_CALVF|nr:peptidyl-prolyl cis-trans isomerase [Calocera viscosa TUFC12733]
MDSRTTRKRQRDDEAPSSPKVPSTEQNGQGSGASNNDTPVHPEEDDEDDDDDIGPMPMPQDDAPRKKRKVLPHESLYLDHLPSADRYWKSFMHRDFVNFVTVTKTEFVITTSIDGHLKFWKKQESGIEFVKHYRAHLAPVIAVSASADGTIYASVAEDGSAKVFDVANFDMINMIKLDYTPLACCWVHRRGEGRSVLAISEQGTHTIRFYDGRGDGQPFDTVTSLHRFPVHVMTYSDQYDIVISADEGGFVEYWQPREQWELPKTIPGLWQFKSATDLYEFRKTKSIPTSITLSPDSSHFVVLSMSDRQIRVFNFLTGKMTRKYDESLAAIQEMQQAGTAIYKVDDMEFGRRLAVERELEKDVRAVSTVNAIWDETGNFILYATLLGIKVVNVVTNRVVRLLGKDETARWLNLSIYQGAPQKKGFVTVAMAASANPILNAKEVRDPTLFCTGYKRARFCMFGRVEPEDVKGQGDRDVFNERPTRDEQSIAAAAPVKAAAALGTQAVIHTDMGDIHIRLFPEHAPKAVENFIGHAKSGYFEGVLFHRVIPKFMIQTGDPLGDGTGGTSIWGKEFEDEFSPSLRHDRPYTVSMANAGPGTNGSQFFITTTVAPWLDNKHTIFGRVVHGLEVVHAIENVKTDKVDKPFEDIKIVNVSVES